MAILADPSLPAAGGRWSRLAEEQSSLFATPEWLELWWKHFGAGCELLLTVEEDAVLPFYVWRERPLRVVRVLGHGPGDELGPFGPGAREALRRWVETEPFDVLVCQQLPGRASWNAALPGGKVVADTGSPCSTSTASPGTSSWPPRAATSASRCAAASATSSATMT